MHGNQSLWTPSVEVLVFGWPAGIEDDDGEDFPEILHEDDFPTLDVVQDWDRANLFQMNS